MNKVMDCSVLGLGTAFLTTEIAKNHGFIGADMESSLFPPRLKRRMSHVTRLALAAAERACVSAGVSASDIPTIFTSIISEIKVTDALCRNIAVRDYPLSPTQFHNSVHNTAAGYWGMVTKNQHPAQAMAAGSNTFAMGLLEAYTQLQMVSGSVLVVCYEETIPQPLMNDSQVSDCAVAFVLSKADADKMGIRVYQQGDNHSQVMKREGMKRSDTDKNWSAVEKALALAKAVQRENNETEVLVSSHSEAWYVDVMKGG